MARIVVDKLLFECPICTEPMDNTWKMLSCQHTFCLKCLETIYKSADRNKKKTKRQCPTCRREIAGPIEHLEKPLLLYDLFDKFKVGQDSEIYDLSRRLAEAFDLCNGGGSSMLKSVKRNSLKSNGGFGATYGKQPVLPASLAADCEACLRVMCMQLKRVSVMASYHPKELRVDQSVQPEYWVQEYFDDSVQSVFFYQLSDGHTGVVFNNGCSAIASLDDYDFLLFTEKGKTFCLKSDDSVKSTSTFSILPHLSRLHRDRSEDTIIMQLTNGTLQINFLRRRVKIIICPLMSAVTYIDVENNFYTYRFSEIIKHNFDYDFWSLLDYARKKIDFLLSS